MAVSRQVHAFLTAVQFLTRVPAPGGMNRPGADASLLRAAVVYFPVVGGLVGVVTGVIAWAGLHVWPPLVAVSVALAVEALLTGGFHEDAVADCCDAFGGGWTRDDVLRILKDSRVGSFGALGLALAVLLRAGCLAAVPPERLIAAAVASAAVGRWAVLVLMAAVPLVPDREGLGKDVAGRAGWEALLGGTAAVAVAAGWYALVEPVRLALGVSLSVVTVGLWGAYVRRRIGGTTGDCLGSACYLAQLAVLLAACGRLP
jgi:adenosylcobinamide-GDP ribazoletransferase